MSRRRSPTRSVASAYLSDGSSAWRSYADTSVVGSTSSAGHRSDRFVTRSTSSGVDRQYRKVARRSGIAKDPQNQLSEEDQVNVVIARNLFIANNCLTTCWPDKGSPNTKAAKEALEQANSQARRNGLPQTDVTKALIRKVS